MEVTAEQDESRSTLVFWTKQVDMTSSVLVLDRGDDAFVRPLAEAIRNGEPIPLTVPAALYRFDGERWEYLAGTGFHIVKPKED